MRWWHWAAVLGGVYLLFGRSASKVLSLRQMIATRLDPSVDAWDVLIGKSGLVKVTATGTTQPSYFWYTIEDARAELDKKAVTRTTPAKVRVKEA